jgi:hypothetical protein
MRCKPMMCGDQVEPCLSTAEDLEATLSRGQAEQDGRPGSRDTQNTRQSHTIQWAVARYVSSPTQYSPLPLLTKLNLGTNPIDCQAEQDCRGARDRDIEEDQAEQCHILQGGSRQDTTPAVPVKKSCGTGRAEHCPAQKELPDEPTEDDQAEQIPTQIRCNPMVCGAQAEPCLSVADDLEATLSRGQAEHDGSPGSINTQNTRQPHTIQWAGTCPVQPNLVLCQY